MNKASRASAGTSALGALAAIGLLGGACFAVLILASVGVYDAVTDSAGIAGLDRPVLDQFIAWRTPQADAVITGFTNLGRTLPMVAIGLVANTALYLRYRRRAVWVLMLIAAAGSVSFTLIGKATFARLRPPQIDAVPPYETSYSFPSGHALNSTVVAGMLAYLTVWLAKRAWVRITAVVAAAAWAITMGLSRIYLGHHWLSDVIFAWLVGLAWLALLILTHQLLLRWFAGTSRALEQAPTEH